MPYPISPIPAGHEEDIFVLSISGGKDSAATALALRESSIPARYVFADTGWEARETYEYLGTMERVLGITIERVGRPGGMIDGIRRRAGFPARVQRWCTKELKIQVLQRYHRELQDTLGVETINVVGIRAEESEERAKMAGFEWSPEWGGYVYRPVIAWPIEEVLNIHHRHGLPVNPLYKRGHSRVGCYPCINANKEELRLIAEHSPERIDLIDDLEVETSALRAARNIDDPDRYAEETATFFQKTVDVVGEDGKPVLTEAGRPKRKGVPFPIREAVAWSRTERGGVQLRLLQDNPRSGCFRWGLCEPPTGE